MHSTKRLQHITASSKTRQAGIGLVEILIAVLLISVGFLAAAKMQVEGMRFSQNAYYQSQAYFMASEMIDRMRSNVEGVAQGHYTDKSTSPSAEDPECGVLPCLPAAIARQDLFDWSTSLHPFDVDSGFVAALPGTASQPAGGAIEEVGNGVFAVIMNWNEVIGGQDAQQTFRIQFAVEDDQS